MTTSKHIPRRLTIAETSRLLVIGRSRGRRPIDAVIDRLAGLDGEVWFREAPAVLSGVSAQAWEHLPSLTLETLREIKERAKTAMASARRTDEVATATAAYFAAIAGALVGHGEQITTRDARDLLEPLTDLAATAPEPWAAMLQAAVRRIETTGTMNPDAG